MTEAEAALNPSTPTQRTLRIVLYAVLAVSILLRLTVFGYMLIFFGIVLLIGVIIHVKVQNGAIQRLPRKPTWYALLILASDLFLFLVFALQADGFDYGIRLPIMFWRDIPPNSSLLTTASSVSMLAVLALIVSWLVLKLLPDTSPAA
jgi:hypothetical protein